MKGTLYLCADNSVHSEHKSSAHQIKKGQLNCFEVTDKRRKSKITNALMGVDPRMI